MELSRRKVHPLNQRRGPLPGHDARLALPPHEFWGRITCQECQESFANESTKKSELRAGRGTVLIDSTEPIELVMNLPLDNIRVIELGQAVSAPTCTAILGDFGADVIKVEPPYGDDQRFWGTERTGLSGMFTSINRNKRSIVVNLKTPEGREVMSKLAAVSDVLVENFKPGTLSRYGLGYDSISSVNPGIVYCSISGFGQSGPYRDRGAYDNLIQGMSGITSMTGERDGPPVHAGVAVCDLFGSYFSAIAILAALRRRDRTGSGIWLDMSLLDVSVTSMSYITGRYFDTGQVPQRSGLAHPLGAPPSGGFATRDGKYIEVAAHKDTFFGPFCNLIGKPELSSDSRFATMQSRTLHNKELLDILNNEFAKKTRDEWIQLLQGIGVPCAPVYSINESLADPQVIFRELVREVNREPMRSKVKIIVNPVKSSEPIWELKLPPPFLGEQTTVILREVLGLDDSEIKRLVDSGAVTPSSK